MTTSLNIIGILSLGFMFFVPIDGYAQTLYETDFSNFNVGEDQLAGTDGWMGTNIGEGVHGIDNEIVAGIGNSAFLGFNPPTTDLVSIYRPNDPDLLASTGTSTIEFNVVFGISDSFNDNYDRFYFSIYDPMGDYLAALVFDNTTEDFGIWVDDGAEQTYTGELFFTDVTYELTIIANFSENSWSAYLDAIPIFIDQSLTIITDTPAFGDVSVEWEIADSGNPGDNWILLDDWTIEAITTPATSDPISETISHSSESVTITWQGSAGVAYQIEYSPDLQQWNDDLPDSLISAGTASGTLSFTDRPGNEPGRYYRVRTMISN